MDPDPPPPFAFCQLALVPSNDSPSPSPSEPLPSKTIHSFPSIVTYHIIRPAGRMTFRKGRPYFIPTYRLQSSPNQHPPFRCSDLVVTSRFVDTFVIPFHPTFSFVVAKNTLASIS